MRVRFYLGALTAVILGCQTVNDEAQVYPAAEDAALVHLDRAERLFIRHAQSEEVLAEIEEALRRCPDWPRAYQLRGYVRMRQGQNRDAVADLTLALAGGLEEPAFAYDTRGMLRRSLGDLDGAIADLTSSIAHGSPAAFLANTYEARADLWYAKGDVTRALQDLEQSIRLCSDHVLARVLRAQIRIDHSEFDDAHADLEAALRTSPGNPIVLLKRADLHLAKGDYSAALADATTVLEHAAPGGAAASDAQRRMDEAARRQSEDGSR